MTCDYRGLRQQSIVVRNTYSSYLGKLICRHLFFNLRGELEFALQKTKTPY